MYRLLMLAVALVVSGCATPPRYPSIDDFPLDKISSLEGRSQPDILSLLGKPTGKVSNAKGIIWEFEGRKQFITVAFHLSSPTISGFVTSGRTKEEAYQPYVQKIAAPDEPRKAGDSGAKLRYPLSGQDRAVLDQRLAGLERGMTVKEVLRKVGVTGCPPTKWPVGGNNSSVDELGNGYSLYLRFADGSAGGGFLSAEIKKEPARAIDRK